MLELLNGGASLNLAKMLVMPRAVEQLCWEGEGEPGIVDRSGEEVNRGGF